MTARYTHIVTTTHTVKQSGACIIRNISTTRIAHGQSLRLYCATLR